VDSASAEIQIIEWGLVVRPARDGTHEHELIEHQLTVVEIARRQSLPNESNGLVSHITINFPWGSLLQSLLRGDPNLNRGLASISQVNTTIDVRSNGGALAEAGTSLEQGACIIYNNLLGTGWRVKQPVMMDSCTLRKFPSTWAKRLAFGRDLRAVQLNGHI
jgi:hypothetical protein